MADTLAGIALPDDLQWVDEFAPWKVGQQAEHTLGGALFIEESARLVGRPITLQAGGTGPVTFAMASRATVEALHALATTPRSTPMVLSYAGVAYNVMFRHPDPFVAEPWKHVLPAASADFYSITLRLIQV